MSDSYCCTLPGQNCALSWCHVFTVHPITYSILMACLSAWLCYDIYLNTPLITTVNSIYFLDEYVPLELDASLIPMPSHCPVSGTQIKFSYEHSLESPVTTHTTLTVEPGWGRGGAPRAHATPLVRICPLVPPPQFQTVWYGNLLDPFRTTPTAGTRAVMAQ